MIDGLKRIAFMSALNFRRLMREVRAYAIGMTDKIDGVVASAETIHGWVAGNPAKEMALASYNLTANPTIVEIGVFMGRSTVLLAAPRRLRGSGRVHSIDPFDCSGDNFSTEHYVNSLKTSGSTSLEEVFRHNVSRMKLGNWVEVHKGTSRSVASTWRQPIDLLLLDGDQTAEGAQEAYDLWVPFLKKGGTIILSNTLDSRNGHDGNHRLAVEQVVAPQFSSIRRIDYHTFAVKAVESEVFLRT